MENTGYIFLESPGDSENTYKDEAIRPRAECRAQDLPAPLAEIRKRDPDDIWASRPAIFLKQGLALADYEDDFEFSGDPLRYYPTYQSLSDRELRGYFSWRTRIRKGIYEAAPLTFIYLHIYELINNIGVKDPLAGYEKLLEIRRQYGPLEPGLYYHLDIWIHDYIIYYNLSRDLLGELPQAAYAAAIQALEDIDDKKPDEVMDAVRQLAPKWLSRSRFYAEHYENMNEIICRVFKKMSARYRKTCKRNFVEQFFGALAPHHYYMFRQAIFCNPLGRKNFKFPIDPQYVYQCENGIWSVLRRQVTPFAVRKMDKLLKTIDSCMRVAWGDRHPVKSENSVKWIIALIQDEIRDYRSEQEKAEQSRIRIDFSSLEKIRQDAAITCERLAEAEAEPEEGNAAMAAVPADVPAPANDGAPELDDAESRLLRCLLYGEDRGWIRGEGLFESVLADGINEKLYDFFGDAVIDDSLQVIDDYEKELKEMFPA